MAFAIGPTLQRLMDSLTFSLAMQPFEVGDKVCISNVAANAVLTVTAVYFYTTEFVDANNKHIVVRNADMQTAAITNLRRSGEATASIKIAVDQTVTMAQVNALRSALAEYVRRKGIAWKPGPKVNFGSPGTSDMCELNVYVTHRSCWQEGKLSTDQNQLLEWLLEQLQQLQIRYRLPPQHLRISLAGADGSTADGAVGGSELSRPTDASASGVVASALGQWLSRQHAGTSVDIAPRSAATATITRMDSRRMQPQASVASQPTSVASAGNKGKATQQLRHRRRHNAVDSDNETEPLLSR